MTDPIVLEKLRLSGFRAYLEPNTIPLLRKTTPLSLVIFAPNGKGKSSLVDSIEYYFSKDGTLGRLGQKQTIIQAGPRAIRHVYAERDNIETFVDLQFMQGNEKFGGRRRFPSPLTKSAQKIQNLAKVPFVIRGYELRRFIEDESPTNRYKELASWLDMNQLLVVQENLRDLKRKVGKMINSKTDIEERMRDVEEITGGAIKEWDAADAVDWLNKSVMAHLDKQIQFKELSKSDPVFQELENLVQAEQEHSNIKTLKNTLEAIVRLCAPPATPQDNPSGMIFTFEKSTTELEDLAAKEKAAQSAAKDSMFDEIWKSAEKLLGGGYRLDICPVCGTEFAKSPRKSQEGACANLRVNLSTLEEYHSTKEARGNTEAGLVQIERKLSDTLDELSILADSMFQHDAIAAYRNALKSWKVCENAPDSTAAIEELTHLHAIVSTEIENAKRPLGKHTYGHALETVNGLLTAKANLERIERVKAELLIIQDHLGQQIGVFDGAITQHIRGLIYMLEKEINSFYQCIQGPDAKVPSMRIELAKEGATNQSAQLLIDFADGCEGALPSGFLSDSQIHTLAIAFRLAAIRLFNDGVKIMVLDDIVNSYDADHRKNIAAVLNDKLSDFQIILVTHDKHFFDMLQDHIPENRCKYMQIRKLQHGMGPIFHDHVTNDKVIENKHDSGEAAGNEMRQAEEEWLSRMCYEFETPTTYSRNRGHSLGELATSLDKFLKKRGLNPPEIPGSSKPFLESLKHPKFENTGSHSNDDPYTTLSVGDAHSRWKEFKYFRDLFRCKCGHKRFKRPSGLQNPVCAKCERQFNFEYMPCTTP